MRGAPARAIQELAGHQDLTTTQRYMHLSPAAIEGAIRLLEEVGPASAFAPRATADKKAGPYVRPVSGDTLETTEQRRDKSLS